MTKKNYYSQVVALLRLEAEAITRTVSRLQREAVERAIQLLVACRGKVVLVGVGKSGYIAQKVAATLTSTGTIAIYLHPSDAGHGGLGIITPADVVIVLSNSGETEEVVAMLPYLQHRQVPIIAAERRPRVRPTVVYHAARR